MTVDVPSPRPRAPGPLSGRRVLVTRPADQASDLRAALEGFGAEVVHAPAIRIAPAADLQPLDAACHDLTRFHWIVVTSANGAAILIDRVQAAGTTLASAPGQTAAPPRLCAVGPATAALLSRAGVPAALLPREHHAEGLVDALRREGVGPGTRVLVVQGDQARDVVSEGLRRQGVEVTAVVAYRTIEAPLDQPGGPPVSRMLREGALDAVVFTSGSTVRAVLAAAAAADLTEALSTVTVACIGPVTADVARAAGLSVDVVAPEATSVALASALAAHFSGDGS
jgi:uroporphyrinogen-III synthase